MTLDTFGSVMRKKLILICKKQKAILVGLEIKMNFNKKKKRYIFTFSQNIFRNMYTFLKL